ncbi:SpoIID/LytB domain protein [Bacillus oleivorans]|uniref:SpoIID/LytB domain protein n=1 Tax=Bacillus oleivorans TaxID=1448271 RepID=A0A285CV72_9BACI|nr:SpoIID/LytB domain-containing protein [Bacillus oleivorans]SNX71471.1 SpoIID/LytB domain protein [Bacillus oleivorans]
MINKMLKVFFAIALVSVLFTQGSIFAAEAEEPIIRIGVVPTAETIQIGSNGSFEIKDKVTGNVLFTGTNEQVRVDLSSTSNVRTNYMLQVAFSTSNAYIQDWLTRAETAGYPTYIEPYNNGWRLLIGEFPADASFAVRTAFKNEVIAKGLAASDAFWRIITIVEGESSLKLTKGESEVTTSNPVVITSSDSLVKINGKQYRGIGEIGFNSNGTLAGINELPIEQYLYGVVPLELPPVPYGELEAQKSQAVAARTYALSNMGKRSSDGFDLLPTTSDQVYGGYDSEHPISTQAVQETRGVVATYEGKLITAVYSSTTGGYTANNEDVWNTDPVPYLRGVPDANRGQAFEHVPTLEVFKNHSNLTSLRNAGNGAYESDWSRYHRWTVDWTNEEISEVLSTSFNTEVGEVYEINVTERSNSGRVLEIEFVTENGTFYEYKDRIRTALKYVLDSGAQTSLRSTLFFIEPVIDNSKKELIGFKAYGGGWGHGVGLSQTGAVGMAEKGHSYEEILKHYYQGIELETRY